MRFSQKLYAQHLGWTFKKHWSTQCKKVPRDTGAATDLKKIGFFIKDDYWISGLKTHFSQEKLKGGTPKSPQESGTMPDWQLKPCHVFSNKNVMLEGIEQAQLLTKSIKISGLPQSIQDTIKDVTLTGTLERSVKEAILSSHLFCAHQEKLSKEGIQLRPEYNLPREYGSPKERKISILVNKLLSECDKYGGRIVSSQRRLIDQVYFRVTVPKNDDLLQFSVNAQKVITSQRPIEAVKEKHDSQLPDMHPINCTISMPKQHIYHLETVYPFQNNITTFHPHTIFAYFDKEKVRNVHDIDVNTSQFQSRTMLKAFCVAAARAKQLYGDSALDSIPRPIVVQSIHTDGRTFHFGVFQLNTLSINNLEGVKNFWFHENNQNLFQICQYVSGKPVLEGFNKNVFKYIYAFYRNS
ncbi:PREDICTED: 39S ribosomal protein L37, mitochondrial [Rhagoletis zephyria]|uniref:39S ribosomal protein L37, mitochondrial n=1 Tax=Rhagoletis zephyria TaxID=28612 RepID=UPI000811567E|nr:PREDICTED: 39S ribosomal protein L37, mitochondrial [Rhagoletis zephyria]